MSTFEGYTGSELFPLDTMRCRAYWPHIDLSVYLYSDSDKDVDESELLSDDSEEDIIGSASDLRSRENKEKKKKANQEKIRRRADKFSDLAEVSEVSVYSEIGLGALYRNRIRCILQKKG